MLKCVLGGYVSSSALFTALDTEMSIHYYFAHIIATECPRAEINNFSIRKHGQLNVVSIITKVHFHVTCFDKCDRISCSFANGEMKPLSVRGEG